MHGEKALSRQRSNSLGLIQAGVPSCPREKESLFRFLKQGSECLGCAIGYRFDVCRGHLSSPDSVSLAVVNACDDGNDTGTVQALCRDCRKQQTNYSSM